LIAGAALLRKGIFPFHFWIPMAFEHGSLPRLNLLLNSHLGAYLLIRMAMPLYPEQGAVALSFLGVLAIVTALYTAMLGLVAVRPRRALALLCTSQASFILAGIENRNTEGITGALVFWFVVALATTSLLAIYNALEARTTEVEAPRSYLGLGHHAPRLAAFFAVSALALVGLPGTLGFAAEDLLFHGALDSHPLLGVGLPLATALNAVNAFRLFTTLFWGRRGTMMPPIADARPRERWALSLPTVLLVGGGLFPGLAVALRAPAAATIASLFTGR
jgi:NADH-quinone oxidoreductase subunit M